MALKRVERLTPQQTRAMSTLDVMREIYARRAESGNDPRAAILANNYLTREGIGRLADYSAGGRESENVSRQGLPDYFKMPASEIYSRLRDPNTSEAEKDKMAEELGRQAFERQYGPGKMDTRFQGPHTPVDLNTSGILGSVTGFSQGDVSRFATPETGPTALGYGRFANPNIGQTDAANTVGGVPMQFAPSGSGDTITGQEGTATLFGGGPTASQFDTSPTGPDTTTFRSPSGQNIRNGIDLNAPYMGRPRDPSSITRIIMHGDVQQNADSLLQYGRRVDPSRGFDPGYHFYIAKDGTVTQGAPIDRMTNHTLGNNRDTIGIVVAGADGGKMPTPAQREAGLRLVSDLGTSYNISPQNVIGHGELQPNRRHHLEGGDIASTIRSGGFIPEGTTAAAVASQRPDAGGFRDAYNKTFANTPLADKYDTVVSEAQRNNVPPQLMAAVMAHETGGGTSNMLRTRNNPAGLMDPNTRMMTGRSFPSVDAGIVAAGQNIGKNYDRGGRTLEGLQRIYAPVGAANDPKGQNKSWTAGVNRYAQRFTPSTPDIPSAPQTQAMREAAAAQFAQPDQSISPTTTLQPQGGPAALDAPGAPPEAASTAVSPGQLAGGGIGSDAAAAARSQPPSTEAQPVASLSTMYGRDPNQVASAAVAAPPSVEPSPPPSSGGGDSGGSALSNWQPGQPIGQALFGDFMGGGGGGGLFGLGGGGRSPGFRPPAGVTVPEVGQALLSAAGPEPVSLPTMLPPPPPPIPPSPEGARSYASDMQRRRLGRRA